MPRSPAASDVFSAVGEAPRRRILELLMDGERSVNEIAEALNLRQPQTSKHLHVLKEVGLVAVRGEAQQRLYRLNGEGIKRIHDWTASFERLWDERLERLDDYLAELQRKGKDDERP